MPGVETCDAFSKLHSCQNVKVTDVFAGGDHSFLTLNENLKRKPQIEVPQSEEIDFSKDDLLFTPDEAVQ